MSTEPTISKTMSKAEAFTAEAKVCDLIEPFGALTKNIF
jgi:hypothetical protein